MNIILTTIFFLLALGDLAAASFTEDKFGVVQRNIPDILMAFTQLQKVSFGSMHLFNLLTKDLSRRNTAFYFISYQNIDRIFPQKKKNIKINWKTRVSLSLNRKYNSQESGYFKMALPWAFSLVIIGYQFIVNQTNCLSVKFCCPPLPYSWSNLQIFCYFS